MRFWVVFKKSMIENFRDWKILILGLTFAPFFVVLMYYYVGFSTETFRVIFINHDRGVTIGDGNPFKAGETLILELATPTRSLDDFTYNCYTNNSIF